MIGWKNLLIAICEYLIQYISDTVLAKQILILQRSRYKDLRTNKWIIYHRHVASFANDPRVDVKQKQSIKLVRLRTVARTCLFISEIVGAL